MKINIILAVGLILSVFLLYGCGESEGSVRVSRKAGISLSPSMVLAIGSISGDQENEFRKELTQALKANGDFKLFQEEPVSSAMYEPISTTLAKKNQSLVVISGKYRASTKDEHKSKDGPNNTKKEYIERTFSGRFAFNLADVTNNSLSFSRELQENITDEKEDAWLLNVIVDAIITDPHYEELRKKAIDAFLYELYPHEEVYHVRFFKEKDMPELEDGISYANIGQWDKAIELFKSATAKYANNEKLPKAYYNLGVAYKWNYKFPEARENLEKAYLLSKGREYRDELETLAPFEQEYLIRQKEQAQPQN
jgi:tetratricopeptide (TPR) repeat protein